MNQQMKNKTIVLADVQLSDQEKKDLANNNCRIIEFVQPGTDYLVCTDVNAEGGKYHRAKTYRTSIVTYEQFQKLIS